MTKKVLVVGAGYSGMGQAIAKALIEAGRKVVSVDDLPQHVGYGPVCAPYANHDDRRAYGWYHQFAGKRGKPPRY